jgi:hypothetical protein
MWELQPLATPRASTACTGITVPDKEDGKISKGNYTVITEHRIPDYRYQW